MQVGRTLANKLLHYDQIGRPLLDWHAEPGDLLPQSFTPHCLCPTLGQKCWVALVRIHLLSHSLSPYWQAVYSTTGSNEKQVGLLKKKPYESEAMVVRPADGLSRIYLPPASLARILASACLTLRMATK